MAEIPAASTSPAIVLPDWPRAFGVPPTRAHIRSSAEDFQVDEVLGFAPDGEGEHILVQVCKRNLNTDQVARQLARHAGVSARDVSYCGLKDRVAVTSQWFSIRLPGKSDPDWPGIESENLQVLSHARHRRKLPRGALKANRFRIVLRDVEGSRDDLEQRLARIIHSGVPNYFGEQRFGHEGKNVQHAQAMFAGVRVKDRHLQGIYLSAARSFLFNEVLAARINDNSWNRILAGEAVMLTGSRSFFLAETVDAEIESRLAMKDISPSGPLWGKGELPCHGEARTLELATLNHYSGLCEGLENAGLKQERRGLRLDVDGLTWHWPAEHSLELSFALPAGAYATAVLREIIFTS